MAEDMKGGQATAPQGLQKQDELAKKTENSYVRLVLAVWVKVIAISATTALGLCILGAETRQTFLEITSSAFTLSNYTFSIPCYNPKQQTPSNYTTKPYTCDANHRYRIEIISTSPLLIYIHDFLAITTDIPALLSAGDALFSPSRTGPDRHASTLRTSSSAGLLRDHPAVQCVLQRARLFMGGNFRSGLDDMGAPQLVRYDVAGQGFGLHHDWWSRPRPDGDRSWNRAASFLVGLEDGCSGGETWFPFVEVGSSSEERGRGMVHEGRWMGTEPVWRPHPDGGVAFRPVAGNAVFWVNLHANGTGDLRTRHAGLPIGEGRKTAMNIWPRRYYSRD